MYATVADCNSYINNFISNNFDHYRCVSSINLQRVVDTGFLFNYSQINQNLDDNFSGIVQLKIVFTSATEYDVFLSIEGVAANLYKVSGTISSNVVIADIGTIPSGTFGGVINSEDVVEFAISRLISENMFTQIILDATSEINALVFESKKLQNHDLEYNYFPTITDTIPTPTIIQLATKKIVATYCMSRHRSAFSSVDEDLAGYISREKNSAFKKVMQAVNGMLHFSPEAFSRSDLDTSENTMNAIKSRDNLMNLDKIIE